MQEEAAEKLDDLLTPIDVSEAIKRLQEQRASYATGTQSRQQTTQ
jgi:hypothetical protein